MAGFPNILMPVAPQNGSASANFPRGIEFGVEWVTELLRYMREHGYTRVEADPKEQALWVERVKELYDKALIRKAQSWLTGYNSNLDGHEKGKIRHVIWAGSFPEFRAELLDIAAKGYPGFNFDGVDHDRAISPAGSLLECMNESPWSGKFSASAPVGEFTEPTHQRALEWIRSGQKRLLYRR